jgi:AraC family transcriptional regulator, regulatory protein of adaptative response / methylated-DNA-[protein]-cysteine methyltransferase
MRTIEMTMQAIKPQRSSARKSQEDERWQAIVNRDPVSDGAFVYAVRTTGVYCRPTCPSRLALRKNVRFFATCHDAERAGFRPCKRCQPTAEKLSQRHASIVAQACRAIELSAEVPSLTALAKAAGLSNNHFHRIFKAQTGITPKAYAAAHRSRRMRIELGKSASVTNAIYAAGFESSSRFYESSRALLGMTPKAFRAGGDGASIRFAIGDCSLGSLLVAASEKGICAILLGDDPDELAKELQDRFPQADLIGGDAAFEQLVTKVVAFVESPALGLDLPLDIRGTAFQRRVWEALRKIPAGSTTTYSEIAERLGHPNSARAVGQAIAANPLAVAIPCHRVIRTDGSLSGYRWGVERKNQLQQRERDP